MPLSEYDKKRLDFINAGRPLPEPKERTRIKPVSDKLAAKKAAQKAEKGTDDTIKEKWFQGRRKEMKGICQCGCGQKSSKYDDVNFRSSACHIFPQRLFESIRYHPLNWVERAHFGGCHGNMDNKSIELWLLFADWNDIKEKFYILAPLLTDKERAKKFYIHLERLVYSK